ncbi:MAG: AmmeMemoRadiSam system radical SAM enzyme [Nanoarchaeota archaeon]|nr:AmmeMemoRadiSam system radical SAM enzyme [Nanoarchaeota archaeon]MBU1946515.1 AmmeMemoRadiSam system radical SAM enzyme [Nanoarchaeota archaeon]
MKEALYYKKLKNKVVNCNLCPTNCVIKPGNFGNCGARKNVDGELFSMIYGKPVSVNVDPIEKKPLYHFFPGSYSLSVGTLGCNLHCLHCQNYDISQAKADGFSVNEVMPEEIIETALRNNCKSISYTYNEPTINYEYVLETVKLARKKGLKNVMVTNGYINIEPLRDLYPYIDAANIDLKSIDGEFYKKICSVRLNPILDAIGEIKKSGTWVELTNLIIPRHNDSKKQIEKLVLWVKRNLSDRVPLHFSAFYPTYKMLDEPRTSDKTLIMARRVALDTGLKYVYIGNSSLNGAGDTLCPKCRKLMVKRDWFKVSSNKISGNLCPYCNEKIEGVFE